MMLETTFAISIGLGLAAACGFRVFVPTLIVGIAARADFLTLADGFEWMGSWVAIDAFGTATVLEVGAYYLPWLDNLLDTAGHCRGRDCFRRIHSRHESRAEMVAGNHRRWGGRGHD